MSTEVPRVPRDRMSPGMRTELVLVAAAVMSLADTMRLAIARGDDEEAETELAKIDETVLYLRNGIGQWEDRVICPSCRKTGPNIVKLKRTERVWGSAVQVGFKCKHCAHEWGFGPEGPWES